MPHLCLCLSHVNTCWRCRLSLGGLEGCHPYDALAVRLAGESGGGEKRHARIGVGSCSQRVITACRESRRPKCRRE